MIYICEYIHSTHRVYIVNNVCMKIKNRTENGNKIGQYQTDPRDCRNPTSCILQTQEYVFLFFRDCPVTTGRGQLSALVRINNRTCIIQLFERIDFSLILAENKSYRPPEFRVGIFFFVVLQALYVSLSLSLCLDEQILNGVERKKRRNCFNKLEIWNRCAREFIVRLFTSIVSRRRYVWCNGLL